MFVLLNSKRFKKSNYKPCIGGLFQTTVMILFSALGAWLLLVPQRRALIRDRVLIFQETTQSSKQNFNTI